jgi:hypothetical protein
MLPKARQHKNKQTKIGSVFPRGGGGRTGVGRYCGCDIEKTPGRTWAKKNIGVVFYTENKKNRSWDSVCTALPCSCQWDCFAAMSPLVWVMSYVRGYETPPCTPRSQTAIWGALLIVRAAEQRPTPGSDERRRDDTKGRDPAHHPTPDPNVRHSDWLIALIFELLYTST